MAKVEATQVLVREGRAAVAALSQGVVDGVSETTAIVGLLAGLEEIARQIDKLVDGIALLAVQTTMLAVSGSVEAARAGEAGRGFAIVSADIRGLARDSGASADEVKELVRRIQVQTGVSRRDFEVIVANSAGEIARNGAIDSRLGDVEDHLTAIQDGSVLISESASAVVTTVNEVLSGTQQIAAAAEQAANAANQAAVAARQQAQSAEDLAVAIEEIASLADALKSGAA